jgi:AcrR family transcriptional regulator
MSETTTPTATDDARRASGRRRARKGEGELLRDEILDAAEDLLVEKGSMDEVTIRSVAKAVGVSAPAIYLHFADKDELFYETCRRVFDVLNQRLIEAFGDADRPVAERMTRAGRAYIQFALEHPDQYLVIFGSIHPDQMDDPDKMMTDPGVQSFEMLVSVIQAGVDAEEFRSDLDVPSVAVAVWGAVHGVAQILITKRGMERIEIPDDDQVIDAVLATLLEGIRV